MLEQTVLLALSQAITVEQLTFSTCEKQSESTLRENTQGESFAAAERFVIKPGEGEQKIVATTLEKTDWNISKSAKLLGISRDMLRYRIEKYRFVRPV
jgi:DNA-binding NtrC family response regulator